MQRGSQVFHGLQHPTLPHVCHVLLPCLFRPYSVFLSVKRVQIVGSARHSIQVGALGPSGPVQPLASLFALYGSQKPSCVQLGSNRFPSLNLPATVPPPWPGHVPRDGAAPCAKNVSLFMNSSHESVCLSAGSYRCALFSRFVFLQVLVVGKQAR